MASSENEFRHILQLLPFLFAFFERHGKQAKCLLVQLARVFESHSRTCVLLKPLGTLGLISDG